MSVGALVGCGDGITLGCADVGSGVTTAVGLDDGTGESVCIGPGTFCEGAGVVVCAVASKVASEEGFMLGCELCEVSPPPVGTGGNETSRNPSVGDSEVTTVAGFTKRVGACVSAFTGLADGVPGITVGPCVGNAEVGAALGLPGVTVGASLMGLLKGLPGATVDPALVGLADGLP